MAGCRTVFAGNSYTYNGINRTVGKVTVLFYAQHFAFFDKLSVFTENHLCREIRVQFS